MKAFIRATDRNWSSRHRVTSKKLWQWSTIIMVQWVHSEQRKKSEFTTLHSTHEYLDVLAFFTFAFLDCTHSFISLNWNILCIERAHNVSPRSKSIFWVRVRVVSTSGKSVTWWYTTSPIRLMLKMLVANTGSKERTGECSWDRYPRIWFSLPPRAWPLQPPPWASPRASSTPPYLESRPLSWVRVAEVYLDPWRLGQGQAEVPWI